ncbi:ATP-dependent zinc metalloprotease FtsH [Nocardioides sp. NPDC057767]|uniref:ATP-dependent zinc metalloprotease FtsH n=1 Tax=unclassified Nocardioides TaxID=2615069 RepID=UPI00366BFBED
MSYGGRYDCGHQLRLRSVLGPGTLRFSAPVKSGPPKEPPKPAPQPPPRWQRWLLPIALAVMIALLFAPLPEANPTKSLSYTDFTSSVTAGKVTSVTIDDVGTVIGELEDGTRFRTQIPTALDTTALSSRLQARGVEITATSADTPWWTSLLVWLPLLLILGLLLWSSRAAQKAMGGMGGAGGFGRSKAKIIEAERPTTRFEDVAGYDGVKQEVGEIVDFLRRPERYAEAGAKGPRGVVMVGPPGTGKTLLARAVAGQAEVPFLSVTGSAFVEMFVGVGAARVRDLFAEARKRAPSIIFIDEIDALGSRTASPGRIGNDEREQTLNQLLAEMDGFDQSTGIVVLAATNRPASLDPALLRPGRFDRQVVVPLPNQSERMAILDVHARNKHLDPGIDLAVVARATPGFSGADLANLVNEAAINAVRDDRSVITAEDLDTARNRVLLGRRETSNALLPEERHAVAVHESGHALVAQLCEHADPVAKVTILPAGMALGATEQLPEAERRLYSEGYLNDLLAVRLGGRAAELIAFGEGSSGAANDLSGATQIAERMVVEFGLSPALGPIGYGSEAPQYLGQATDENLRRPYSEQTQRVIDREIARLLGQAQERALALLRAHRTALDHLARLLQERETLDGAVVSQVLAEEAGDGGRGAPLRSVPDKFEAWD